MKDRHGWNSWDGYLAVHQKRLADFHGHFLLEDRLTFTRTRDTVFWSGELLCADGIEIHVTKRQTVRERRGRTEVQTTDYSYQVLRRTGSSVRPLFRYDNAAHHDHPDAHHRHRYDEAGVEIDPPEHVGRSGWPTMGDVIDEAHDLWQRLRLPSSGRD